MERYLLIAVPMIVGILIAIFFGLILKRKPWIRTLLIALLLVIIVKEFYFDIWSVSPPYHFELINKIETSWWAKWVDISRYK